MSTFHLSLFHHQIVEKMKTVLFVMTCCILFIGKVYAQVEEVRIEPPSWWVGMKNNRLQLLIHSDSITQRLIKITKPGVIVNKITKSESCNYLFVDLIISKTTKPGSMAIQVGQKKINYPLLAREENSAKRKGYSNADAIYLITPDRFADGDITNDDVSPMPERTDRSNINGRHGGDIQGIIDHLDYISDMGFTAIWPTPLLENNLPTYSYHGYAISDFYTIDPRFGTNESYWLLSMKAKAKGIKLIMDVVLNHCGSGHWWMKDMPYKDWINYEGRYVNTNHRRETNMDPHASEYDKEIMRQGWFVPTMPDLNQRNPFMATYLTQNTIWWIEYAGLSGLRIDTYPYIDKDFSARWSTAVMQEYPNLNIVGEEWSYNPAITSYWQYGQKNKDGYVSSLRSVMDFPLQEAIVRALTDGDRNDFDGGWSHIYTTIALDYLYPDPYNLVIFADNHDMIRFFTRIHEDFDLWKLGMVYLCTTRGIPEIYYGSEILMNTPSGTKQDGEIRSDMPGGWPGDHKNAFTKEGLNFKEIEAQSLLRQLLNLRKNTPALQYGSLTHFAPEGGLYTYVRSLGKERYLIVLNKNEKMVSLNLNKLDEIIQGKISAQNALNFQTEYLDQALPIPGKGYKILKLSE